MQSSEWSRSNKNREEIEMEDGKKILSDQIKLEQNRQLPLARNGDDYTD